MIQSINAQLVDEISVAAHAAEQSIPIKSVQKAFDKAKPFDNSSSFTYKQGKTFHITLREGTNTLIVLPKGEIIQDYILGDTQNFKFVPFTSEWKNRGEIRPKRADVDTNLTITGRSGNIYLFYLRTESVVSSKLPHFIIYIKDKNLPKVKPEKKHLSSQDLDYLRTREVTTLTEINRRYKILQDDSPIKPSDIFDDGHGWTYFRFGDKNLDLVKQLPQIYKVVGQKDMLVNSMVKGGFIIVKTISDKWTIRTEDDYVCVRAI